MTQVYKNTLDLECLSEPTVSVIMANYCGAKYIERAVRSVLAQTIENIEIIVVDDASTDNSLEILRGIAAEDQRVEIVAVETNAGPGASRNLALSKVKGKWVAIVDSDDVIHPERFEILLDWAGKLDTDAIADDLVFFPANGSELNTTLLEMLDVKEPLEVTAEYFLESDTDGSSQPPLGYLKPVFKRKLVADLRYPDLFIGEDYEFLLNFLLDKGFMHIVPEALYFYRRHTDSISFRLSESTVTGMIEYQKSVLDSRLNLPDNLKRLMELRISCLQKKLQFEQLITGIKSRCFSDVAVLLFKQPKLLFPLSRSLLATTKRRLKSRSQW
ncbi:MAG: glycosyltransferase family 2 protein, partial [Hyphomicrobiales bacterium]